MYDDDAPLWECVKSAVGFGMLSQKSVWRLTQGGNPSSSYFLLLRIQNYIITFLLKCLFFRLFRTIKSSLLSKLTKLEPFS